jgi:hypothetical protein
MQTQTPEEPRLVISTKAIVTLSSLQIAAALLAVFAQVNNSTVNEEAPNVQWVLLNGITMIMLSVR